MPKRGKVTGLKHQHLVACAEGVDQGSLPGASARSRVNQHRVSSFKNFLQVCHHLQAQGAKFWAAVVNGGQADGAQNAVRHWRGARDLQEMPPSRMKVKMKHVQIISGYRTFLHTK